MSRVVYHNIFFGTKDKRGRNKVCTSKFTEMGKRRVENHVRCISCNLSFRCVYSKRNYFNQFISSTFKSTIILHVFLVYEYEI